MIDIKIITRSVTLLMLILLVSPCLAQPTILVVGDSLSAAYGIPVEAGWVSLFANKLKTSNPQATVINSSISGDTTANGLRRLPDLLNAHHPNIVIVELGANDGLRGLPLAKLKANLAQIIELCLKANAKVLLIGMRLPPNYGAVYSQQFALNYTQLSEEYHIPLVPFLLDNIAIHPEYMQADRLHPTAQAQGQIVENIWPFITPLLAS